MTPNYFSTETATFELPCLTDAIDLFEQLQPKWLGWIENGSRASSVIIVAPERISELDELLADVQSWIDKQAFIAIRFRLDDRRYIMRRGGFVGKG